MDCPSEEQLIRTALAPISADARLEFDIPHRKLTIWHREPVGGFESALEALGLGASLESSEATDESDRPSQGVSDQTGVLRTLLAVNAAMFVVEMVLGWIGQSTGLLSDGLDMLADALVYGVALWAVGKTAAHQRRAARVSGLLQLALAIGVIAEVARRAISGSSPEPPIMLATAALALGANVYCLVALTRHRDGGVHMRASWIFSANDVIANVGIIAAAILVYITSSRIPDLIIGALIGAVVLRGAIRILKLSRRTPP